MIPFISYENWLIIQGFIENLQDWNLHDPVLFSLLIGQILKQSEKNNYMYLTNVVMSINNNLVKFT